MYYSRVILGVNNRDLFQIDFDAFGANNKP
jgi:hypothetical protein